MSNKVYNVLFICTGNTARSIMAEGLMRHLGKGRFVAYSAGSMPKGDVNPLALRVLAKHGIAADGFRSKSWGEFAAPDAPEMHFVLTVCDDAAGEVCPVWPGQPMTARWGVPDPSAADGSDAQKLHAFFETSLVLRRRIELLLSLPLDKLDRLAIQNEIGHIGAH